MAQIRGPFNFPLGSPQTFGTGGVIMLASGGIYVVPPGEYLVIAGQQTVIQYFEQSQATWRVTTPPGGIEQLSSDGSNYRLVNMSGVVVGASITAAGSGGTNGIGPLQTGTTVTFTGPPAGGTTATAQGYAVVGGSVAAPTIVQGGSGFLVPPMILIDPPPNGGVQATATATISSAGVVTAITMQNVGAGYVASPNFYVVPQPMFYQGSNQYPPVVGTAAATPGNTGGAGVVPAPGLIHPNNVWGSTPYAGNVSSASGVLLTGVALTGSGTLTGIVMTYYGAGYTGLTIPSVSFAGGGLAAATATAIMSMCILTMPTTGTAGVGYTVGDPWISSLGLVASSSNNNLFSPLPARGTIAATTGFTGTPAVIEYPGFGLQKVPNIGTLLFTTSPGTVSTCVPTCGGQPDTSILQPGVQ